MLFFKVTGTDVFDITPEQMLHLQLTGTKWIASTFPAGTTTEQELVVTKFKWYVQQHMIPTDYTLTFASSVAYLNFTGSMFLEAGSKL